MDKDKKNITENEETQALTLRDIPNPDYAGRIAVMTPEQKEECLVLAQDIDPKNLKSVVKYGSDLNKILGRSGEELLTQVRSYNPNEIIGLTNDLLGEIKDISINAFDGSDNGIKGGLARLAKSLPIVRWMIKQADTRHDRMDTVANNLDKIENKFSSAGQLAVRDHERLQGLFNDSVHYIQESQKYILAGKLKIEEIKVKLQDMMDNPGDYQPHEIMEMQGFLNMMEKRVTDLQTSEYAHSQGLLQIKAAQANDTEIATRCDYILNNALPIWRHQLALSVDMDNQKNSVEMLKRFQETTQNILIKNAEILKANTVEMARQSEKGTIEKETLQKTKDLIISTMREVQQIHQQGAQNRQNLDESLKRFADEVYEAMQNTTW